MSTKYNLDTQVAEFHREIVEFVKKYQFRDRNEMVSCGISVSQCYILETLNTYGTLNAQELADKMYLKISTITRLVDSLVERGFVSREKNPEDQRFKLIKLSRAGKKTYLKAWSAFFSSEKRILENLTPEQRVVLIDVLKALNSSFTKCQAADK